MSEKNFDSINEQDIAMLYGDIIEEPIQVAGWVDIQNDGCGKGFYCRGGSIRKVGLVWGCVDGGICTVCDTSHCKRD